MSRSEEDTRLRASRIYVKALQEDEFRDAWNAYHAIFDDARRRQEELTYLAREGKFWDPEPTPLDEGFEAEFGIKQQRFANRVEAMEKKIEAVKKACDRMIKNCESEIAYFRWLEQRLEEKLKRGVEAAGGQ